MPSAEETDGRAHDLGRDERAAEQEESDHDEACGFVAHDSSEPGLTAPAPFVAAVGVPPAPSALPHEREEAGPRERRSRIPVVAPGERSTHVGVARDAPETTA